MGDQPMTEERLAEIDAARYLPDTDEWGGFRGMEKVGVMGLWLGDEDADELIAEVRRLREQARLREIDYAQAEARVAALERTLRDVLEADDANEPLPLSTALNVRAALGMRGFTMADPMTADRFEWFRTYALGQHNGDLWNEVLDALAEAHRRNQAVRLYRDVVEEMLDDTQDELLDASCEVDSLQEANDLLRAELARLRSASETDSPVP